MIRVLCVGSAACMEADLAAAGALGCLQDDGWLIVAVNHAARDWPRHLHHWATMHPDLLPRWLDDRGRAGRPAFGTIWTTLHRPVPAGIGSLPIRRAPNWAGSSGLLAVAVATEELGAEKVVLAGIPLDHEQGHYDDGKKWRDAVNYRRGWVDHKADMVNVRSMSGWTAELLGTPTPDWLAADPVPRETSVQAQMRRQGGRR